jgi:hypothetical protein
LTDLGEIDKFVKEQAGAIPSGEAEVSYWLEKPAAMLLTAAQILVGAVCAVLATRK